MIDQHNSLAEKFLKKGFWLYLFSFIIAPIGYIIKIIISGELTVSEVGILYGIISLITMISAYNDLGMAESMKYFIPKFVTEKRYDKVKSILTYALFAQIITSLIIATFFYFGAGWIAENYFKTDAAKETLQIFAFFFIGINIFQTLNNFFLAIQDTFYSKLTELIRMGFIMISVLVIFFLDFGNIVNYSYSWLIGLYIGVITAMLLFYKQNYRQYLENTSILFDKKLIKSIYQYALLVLAGTSIGTLLGQIDMQMIIYMLGATDAGYYTNYLSIIGIPFMLIGPIFGLLFPIFSEMHSKGETEKIRMVKSIFQKNFLAIGIAFNILFFVCAEIIAFILFGEKFIPSGEILRYSILLLIFNFLLQINFNIMAGVGKVKERIKIIGIALVVNIITNIIFIKLLGVAGAALATGIGWLLIWILSERVLGKKYKMSFDYKFIGKNIGVLGILGYVLHMFNPFIFSNISRGYDFLIMFIIGCVWYGIFTLLNIKEFKFFISEIKKIKK
ncbi:MAG: polysaccharide biosynthesis protein [Candidatus Gracilibacteria bacterium]|nr:polysaccharide biosynthesis protein [Candidatus Gracilibacteria bacterium]